MFVLLLNKKFSAFRQNLIELATEYSSIVFIQPSIEYNDTYCALADIANQLCEQLLCFDNTDMLWSSPAVLLLKDISIPNLARYHPGIIYTNSNDQKDDIDYMIGTPTSISKICKSTHYLNNLQKYRVDQPDQTGRWQNLIWYANRIGLTVTG